MKILYWNIRGVANPDSQMELHSICVKYKPDFVCISEPMTLFSKIPMVSWSPLHLKLVETNSKDPAPNLWLLCSEYLQTPTVIWNGQQQITISTYFDNKYCFLTFIYASTSYLRRHFLWQELQTMRTSFSNHWMMIGDFNAVLRGHEKQGGCPPHSSSCSDFQAMSDTCDMVHLNTPGASYTSSNGWCSRGYIQLRLLKEHVSP